jgi:two-component system, OmpR family, response regulator MprA
LARHPARLALESSRAMGGCGWGRLREETLPSGKLILVVDDEKAIRELLCRVLAIAGYEVEAAADGYEALERVSTRRPDLILLDLMMPVLDGWTVLDRLRDTTDPPPVVVVSAYLDRGRAVAAGASGYIDKPFRSAELLDACRRILIGRRDE